MPAKATQAVINTVATRGVKGGEGETDGERRRSEIFIECLFMLV